MRAMLIAGAVLVAAAQLWGDISVNPDERAEVRVWMAAKVLGEAPSIAGPGLLVLANNDPVHKNERGGKPLKIADKTYTRGLYCHAVSSVVVKLPEPGKTFSAIAGIDSNEQTSGGRGSVIFSVVVGGKQVWRSDVRREGMPGVPVQIDLGGAKEFTLQIGDAGDGIACDQSDWADAQVAMQDGTTAWLGEMPFIEKPAGPFYTSDPFFSFVYDGKASADPARVEARACDAQARRSADRAHPRVERPEDRPAGPVRDDRVPGLPDRRVDDALQEHGHGRHADP